MANRRPGTASRLMTGMNRPMTRGANLSNQNLFINPTKADDRPMTRGGLGGLQTSAGGFNRTVQDKTYYLGLLRSKITEINNEIFRMNKEITNITSDNSNYLSYGRKAEELNQQIEDTRGELADYNMVLDRLNTASSATDIRNDFSNLKIHNDQEAKSLDLLFNEKIKKEEVVKRHEKEIAEEKKRRENALSTMSGSIRARYEKVKLESERLQEKLNSSEKEIETYKNNIEMTKQKMGMSNVKQEALNLLDRLNAAEMQRDELIYETKNVLTPAEEREKLLKQIKENNEEISTLEKQISELKEQIESMKVELEEKPIEETEPDTNENDENKKEMAQKYKELRKREIQWDEFLNNYDENKKGEIDQLYTTRKSIVNYLELISKAVERIGGTGGKRGKDSELTVADLRKVEELEKNINNEYDTLKEKKKTMDEEMVMFADLEGLKRRSEARKQQLHVERENLSRFRKNIGNELRLLQLQYESLQAQLFDNDTHNQLNNLEKKMQSLEQTQFGLKEKIYSANAEGDYESIKRQVLGLVAEHNRWIQKQLINPSNY